MSVVGAALVPGMPHLLAAEPAPSWKVLADAAREAGRRLRAAGPEAFVVLSTQWFTVLGHQFQVDPNPRGGHVDENWYAYDYGTLDYDLRVDVELAEGWAAQAEAMGFQARRTRYDGFPIDTGTVTAGKLVDPDRSRPIALVSCNLYAAADDLGRIAQAAVRAADGLGRRVAFVAVSGLSSGLIQRWIEPGEDRIENADHDAWNRRVLDLLAAGRLDEVQALRERYAHEAKADSQFRAMAFLAGSGACDRPATVLEYGPVWGTGAAVVIWLHE
jgi:2-aminophenol/2-amino-5-chlorophenol 1,6-dioxygenase alpha subunit